MECGTNPNVLCSQTVADVALKLERKRSCDCNQWRKLICAEVEDSNKYYSSAHKSKDKLACFVINDFQIDIVIRRPSFRTPEDISDYF